MPNRATAMFVCSCGLRIGNFIRAAASEELEAAERELVRNVVPRLVRHWRLGHDLTFNPKTQAWARTIVLEAARNLAAESIGVLDGSGGNPSTDADRKPQPPGQQPQRGLLHDDDS